MARKTKDKTKKPTTKKAASKKSGKKLVSVDFAGKHSELTINGNDPKTGKNIKVKLKKGEQQITQDELIALKLSPYFQDYCEADRRAFVVLEGDVDVSEWEDEGDVDLADDEDL